MRLIKVIILNASYFDRVDDKEEVASHDSIRHKRGPVWPGEVEGAAGRATEAASLAESALGGQRPEPPGTHSSRHEQVCVSGSCGSLLIRIIYVFWYVLYTYIYVLYVLLVEWEFVNGSVRWAMS